jgi:hypothetical protein
MGVQNEYSREKIFYEAFSRVKVQFILDAFHHLSMNPFYPIMNKPLYRCLSGP